MKFIDDLFDINNKDEQLVTGLNKELNSVYVYDYFNKYINNILLVTNSLYEANDLYNRLSNYTDRVLFFPMDDFMTSEASIISPELMIERLNTLNKLGSFFDLTFFIFTSYRLIIILLFNRLDACRPIW